MYIQEIVEVIIGLFFIFLLMSLATMSARETVSGWFKWRSKMLEEAIVGLVSEQVKKPEFWPTLFGNIRRLFSGRKARKSAPAPPAIARDFFANPIITALHQPGSKPSYIPGRQFAKAVIDETTREIEVKVLDAAEDALFGLFQGIDKALDEGKFEDLLKGVLRKVNQSKLVPEAARAELLALANDSGRKKASLEAQAKDFFQKYPNTSPVLYLHLGIEALKLKGEQHLADSLRLIVKDAEASLATDGDYLNTVLTKTENWFDHTMDRLEGWYKRRTGRIALVVGILLALVLNVDTFQVATALWKEPALRQTIVAQAEKVTPEQLESEFGASGDLTTQVRQFSDKLTDELQLPVGWRFRNEEGLCIPAPKIFVPEKWENYKFGILASDGSCRSDFFSLGIKVLGIFITGIAAAQNSSFWFDSLDKLINVRNAGKKPTSTTKETA